MINKLTSFFVYLCYCCCCCCCRFVVSQAVIFDHRQQTNILNAFTIIYDYAQRKKLKKMFKFLTSFTQNYIYITKDINR